MFLRISFCCLSWKHDLRLMSNKPTHYLLHDGDFQVIEGHRKLTYPKKSTLFKLSLHFCLVTLLFLDSLKTIFSARRKLLITLSIPGPKIPKQIFEVEITVAELNKQLHTYIHTIGHYNSSGRIIGLASHHTYFVC